MNQSVQNKSVRSVRARRHRNELSLLGCLSGLVLVKVDDLTSHQDLYMRSLVNDADRSRHGGLFGVVTYFTGSPEHDGYSYRTETLAACGSYDRISGAVRRSSLNHTFPRWHDLSTISRSMRRRRSGECGAQSLRSSSLDDWTRIALSAGYPAITVGSATKSAL
jgi:hypothetical protein